MTDGKEQARQRYVPAAGQPIAKSTHDSATTACRSCHHLNPGTASFCEECGETLAGPMRCGNCQSATHPGADICEACGTWLLTGQCMFCYASVEEGESFCAECGNPAQGVHCHRCGQVSIFDFCKTCGQALTEQANLAVAQAAADPDLHGLAALASALVPVDMAPVNDPALGAPDAGDEALQQAARQAALSLRAYRESIREVPTPAPTARAPGGILSESQKAQISQLNDAIAQEARRREEEALRQRLEAERQRREAQLRQEQALQRQRDLRDQLLKEMAKLSGKTFWSHQEARRFSMALLAGIPPELLAELKRSGLGWRCNAYDCIHDTPSDCADPSKGGVWLVR